MFVSVCPKSCSAGVISADLDTPEGSGALSEDGGNCTAGREGAENKMAGARPFWRSQVFCFNLDRSGSLWIFLLACSQKRLKVLEKNLRLFNSKGGCYSGRQGDDRSSSLKI